jgi:predicted ester cyclase
LTSSIFAVIVETALLRARRVVREEGKEECAVSAEENKALIRRYFEEIDAAAREKRDASVLDEFLAPDFVDHDPSPGFAPDSEGLKRAHEHFLAATPDGYHIVEDMIAEGDKVMTRVSAYGTQTGELFGIPPTGKHVRATGIAIHRIANGKIVEHWSEVDNLGVMQQLGVVPPPGVPPPEQSGTHPS